jgi:ferrochelatase
VKKAVLLLNLGTPDAPTAAAIYRYLTQFLNDPRVIDLPSIIRWILINLFVIPKRYKNTLHAYQSIWTPEGSPLLVHSQAIQQALQQKLIDHQVVLGMRYGKPSIEDALKQISDCDHLEIIPLFPQYASAATGSALAQTLNLIQDRLAIPSIHLLRDFYQEHFFIQAQAARIKQVCQSHQIDHYVLSYHGLPTRHIQKICGDAVCTAACPQGKAQSACYRAQCFATSRALAQELKLTESQYSVAFQSRLGKTPWIQPYFDQLLNQLAAAGNRNIAVVCPSFIADCLETLEEINIRARQQWQSLGGDEFIFVPCVGAHPIFIEGLTQWFHQQTTETLHSIHPQSSLKEFA